MFFPARPFSSISSYFDAYADAVSRALASVDRHGLEHAAKLLAAAIERDAQIYACGNGGSAAISNHLVCDYSKGIHMNTGLRPRVRSLSSSFELMTATANDISYADVFGFQLQILGRPGDLLIAISSSGDSENIVRAIEVAKQNGLTTIALTGFSGGRAIQLADIALHVAAENYGIVEDVHQSIMHGMAQFIRQTHMPPNLIGTRKF